MLQQILKDMYIEPELLAELSDEQKQILFFKMREEQVRRWKEWNSKVERQKKVKKTNGRTNVDFLLDSQGNPWVWVMGEHKEDKSIEQILEEESLEAARKEAHEEAEEKRLKEIEERKKVEEEERQRQKQLKEEREKISKEKAILEEKAKKIKEEEERRKQELKRKKEQEEKERLQKVREEKAKKEKELEIRRRKDEQLRKEKEEKERTRRENELKKIEEERLKKEKQATEIKEQERLLRLKMEKEEKENKQKDAKFEKEEKERTQEIYSTLQKKRRQSAFEAEKNRDRIEQIWNVQLRKSRVADKDRSSWAQVARDTVRRSRMSQDFGNLSVNEFKNHSKERGTKPKSRSEAIEWFKDIELPKKAGFDLITNRPDTWMHGPMSRSEVEELLKNEEYGTFLVRLSERIWGYTLSFKDNERVKHFLIDASLAGYQFFGTDQIIHQKLKDLIEFHKMQPISEFGKEILKVPLGQVSAKPDYDILL